MTYLWGPEHLRNMGDAYYGKMLCRILVWRDFF